jgi:hypothetical protein
VFRLSLLRTGGTPGQRSFVIASTIILDTASDIAKNIINDPTYVRNHYENWVAMWSTSTDPSNKGAVELDVSKDIQTVEMGKKALEQINKEGGLGGKKTLIPEDFDLNSIGENLINGVLEILKPILNPVYVDYPANVLSEQIHSLAVLLFIMSILISILLVAFMFNIIIYVFSDKLINIFTNKYIRWYIGLNKKVIGVEICFLGGSILYFMYILSYGIHFIATHPVIIT